jgi:hypothetical protein
MKNVDKFVFAARASSGVAMVFAVTWIFNSFVCVVPWLEAAHKRFSLIVAVGFLLLFSFAAILYGIAKGRRPRVKESKAKRICAWLLFFALIFGGSGLLTVGHEFHVKAKVRESEKQERLERDGYYENPYLEWHRLCDVGGVACFGTLGLWICAALLNKTAELMTRGVIACAHKSANKTDNSTTERSTL